jgi:outer membrane protein
MYRFLLILVASSVALVAYAEKRSLTVDQAIAVGLENSKALHSSREKVSQADARLGEMNAGRLPSLKLTGGYTRLSTVPDFTVQISPLVPPVTVSSAVLDNYQLNLSLQQPLFTGFRLQAGSSAARYSVDASQQDLEKDKRDFVYNVRNAYWNVYKAREFKNVMDSAVAQMQSHLNDVQNMATQGLATTNDVLKVQVQLSSVKLQQIDATNGVQLASMALANTIGLPLDTEIEIGSTLTAQPRSFAATSSLVSTALTARPDLKAMEARVQAGEEGVTAARGGWWPNVFLAGTYTYARPNSRIFPTRDQFDGTWTAGVQLSWDVWTWGTAGYQTTQAQAQLEQAKDALGLMRDGASLEVQSNALLVSKSKERIATADQTVKQAEENLRVTNDKYKAGLVLNSEVLDAEVALLQARLVYTQAVVDFELAQAGLEKAAGM